MLATEPSRGGSRTSCQRADTAHADLGREPLASDPVTIAMDVARLAPMPASRSARSTPPRAIRIADPDRRTVGRSAPPVPSP